MANLPIVEDTNIDGMALGLDEVDALGFPHANIDLVLVCSIEEFKSCLEKLQENIHTFSLVDKEAIVWQLQVSKDNLSNVLTPKDIDSPTRGRIQKIQTNGTQIQLGHEKQPATNAIFNANSYGLQATK